MYNEPMKSGDKIKGAFGLSALVMFGILIGMII